VERHAKHRAVVEPHAEFVAVVFRDLNCGEYQVTQRVAPALIGPFPACVTTLDDGVSNGVNVLSDLRDSHPASGSPWRAQGAE
jgi:hypothetical protein